MIDLKIDSKAFGLALRRAPAAIFSGAVQGIKLTHAAFHTELRKLHRGAGETVAGPTLRPQIVRTIGQEVSGTDINSLRSVSFTAHIAARIQEHGGTITANGRYSVCGKGKMLAIPLAPAKTRGGRGLASGRAAAGTGSAGFARTGPCDRPDLFPIRSKRGNLLLVKRKGGSIVPWYVLKRSVNIKPGLHFFETFSRVVRTRLAEILGGRIFAAMQRVFAKGGT